MLEDGSAADGPRKRQRLAGLGDEAVRERGVARAGGVGRVGGECGEERERGRGAEAGVRDGGRHVGEPRARVAAQRERMRGQEEEQLRGQGGAAIVARRPVRDEAGRVDLPRDGGHLHGDGGRGGGGGEVCGGSGDGVRWGERKARSARRVVERMESSTRRLSSAGEQRHARTGRDGGGRARGG